MKFTVNHSVVFNWISSGGSNIQKICTFYSNGDCCFNQLVTFPLKAFRARRWTPPFDGSSPKGKTCFIKLLSSFRLLLAKHT